MDLVLLPRDLVDRQRDRGGRQVDHGIDALVEPLPGDAGADIGLVLVVALQDLHLEAAAAEILHRLLGQDDAARPVVSR